MKCGICKTSRVETDRARDISYCTTCGLIVEESTIVSDVQFAQDTKGTSVLQGQYVSHGESKKLVAGKFIRTNHMAEVRSTAKSIADSLGIGETQVNAAMRWYNLALQFNFTKGRKRETLLAACLYITCREEETPHMLIDFAGVLRINVFRIGSIFLRLIRLLNISVPLVDPSLFVPRFCSKLQLPQGALPRTALRLIARMDRDWMVIGRKPAGICGAAILVASRIHNTERTLEEVANVVKVCEATITKRLTEMKETASASLSINEFNTVWLDKEEDPPVVKRGRLLAPAGKKEPTTAEKEEEVPLSPLSVVAETEAESPLDEAAEISTAISTAVDTESDVDISSDALLTQEEIKEKGALWEAMHGDYLRERNKKEKKIRPKEKEKKKKIFNLEDAVETTVKSKNLSSRINYAAIKNLFQK